VLGVCLEVTGYSALFHALPIGLGNGHKGRQSSEEKNLISFPGVLVWELSRVVELDNFA